MALRLVHQQLAMQKLKLWIRLAKIRKAMERSGSGTDEREDRGSLVA